jgi:hypothetical protein
MSYREAACCTWTAALVALLCACRAGAQTTAQDLLDWGLDAHAKTTASLQVPGNTLFAESASLGGQRFGGNGGFAYVWPLSTQFRVQTALVRHDPAAYSTLLRQFSDEARQRYWRSAGGGYRSGVSGGATLFYDDNAHMAIALMEAYRLTADPAYLTRAQETYNFVLSGEDSAGGGGIYFNVPDRTVKETISTLQAVRAGLMLYRATAQPSYLEDATRLYEWTRTHVQQPDGLFLERYYLTGPNAGTAGDFALVNGAGDAISLQLEFFAATGDAAHLQEAQRIALRSLSRYFNSSTGAINDEGFWAYELVDALCELSRVDGNPLWRTRTVNALRWLHSNRRDPNGHYDTLWGRGGPQTAALASWDLNDNAAVARSFLQAALTEPVPADFNADGVVDAGDLARWTAGFGAASTALLAQGDSDRDRDVDGADFLAWQRGLGATSSILAAAAVPEPAAALLALVAAALAIGKRHTAGRPRR